MPYATKYLLPLLHSRALRLGPQTMIVDGGDELKPFGMTDDEYVWRKHYFYRQLRIDQSVQHLVEKFEHSSPHPLSECVGVHVRRFIVRYDGADDATFDE